MREKHVFPASVEQNERSQSLVWVSTPQRGKPVLFSVFWNDNYWALGRKLLFSETTFVPWFLMLVQLKMAKLFFSYGKKQRPAGLFVFGQRPKQVYLVRLGPKTGNTNIKSKTHPTSPALDWSIMHCACRNPEYSYMNVSTPSSSASSTAPLLPAR